MKWLVTGAGGMLGREAVTFLAERGEEVTAARHRDLDITSETDARAAAAGHDVVINCAAWTAVDQAEEQEADAFKVNAEGPAHLARACRVEGATLVHISTDYVFDGVATEPYAEGHPLRPQSAYGRTKAAGEWAVRAEHPEQHLIVRTGWLYGAHGNCFPKTMHRLLTERGEVSVVTDQVGQPTWTRDVCAFILDLVSAQAPSGAYHATASGEASWHDFTVAICESGGRDPASVKRTTAADFSRPAPRPAYSVLGHDAAQHLGVATIPYWRERWAAAAPAVLGASSSAGAD